MSESSKPISGPFPNEIWLQILEHVPNFGTLMSTALACRNLHNLAFDDGIPQAVIANQFDPRVLKVAYAAMKAHEPASWLRAWPPAPPNNQNADFQRALEIHGELDIGEIRQLARFDAAVDFLSARFAEYAQLPISISYRGSKLSKEEILRVRSAMYRIQVLCGIRVSPAYAGSSSNNDASIRDFTFMTSTTSWEYEQIISIKEWMQEEVRLAIKRLCKEDLYWREKFVWMYQDDSDPSRLESPISKGLLRMQALMTAKSYWRLADLVEPTAWRNAPEVWYSSWNLGESGMIQIGHRISWHPDNDPGPAKLWSWSHNVRLSNFNGRPLLQTNVRLRNACRRRGCYFWDEANIGELVECDRASRDGLQD